MTATAIAVRLIPKSCSPDMPPLGAAAGAAIIGIWYPPFVVTTGALATAAIAGRSPTISSSPRAPSIPTNSPARFRMSSRRSLGIAGSTKSLTTILTTDMSSCRTVRVVRLPGPRSITSGESLVSV